MEPSTQKAIDGCNAQRKLIRDLAFGVLAVKEDCRGEAGEAIANVVLAYRHLEDASMRLGKAIQALDGGTSVYDKETTVGA